MIVSHTVYSKDKVLKRYIAIEFFHSVRDPVCKRRMLGYALKMDKHCVIFNLIVQTELPRVEHWSKVTQSFGQRIKIPLS